MFTLSTYKLLQVLLIISVLLFALFIHELLQNVGLTTEMTSGL